MVMIIQHCEWLNVSSSKFYVVRILLGGPNGKEPTCQWASLVAQRVKIMPAMWETWVQSLGWEDPMEEGVATHLSILAWRISWTEEPSRLQSLGLQSQA